MLRAWIRNRLIGHKRHIHDCVAAMSTRHDNICSWYVGCSKAPRINAPADGRENHNLGGMAALLSLSRCVSSRLVNWRDWPVAASRNAKPHFIAMVVMPAANADCDDQFPDCAAGADRPDVSDDGNRRRTPCAVPRGPSAIEMTLCMHRLPSIAGNCYGTTSFTIVISTAIKMATPMRPAMMT